MKKSVQYFTKEYLERCAGLTPDQIIEFLENYRNLIANREPEKSILISMRVDASLLALFKTQAEIGGIPYQTQIKNLMRAWLEQGQ
jgi:predicted DNA binding CopG/RHH family protein